MAYTLGLAEIRGGFRLVVRTTLFVVRACLNGRHNIRVLGVFFDEGDDVFHIPNLIYTRM